MRGRIDLATAAKSLKKSPKPAILNEGKSRIGTVRSHAAVGFVAMVIFRAWLAALIRRTT